MILHLNFKAIIYGSYSTLNNVLSAVVFNILGLSAVLSGGCIAHCTMSLSV